MPISEQKSSIILVNILLGVLALIIWGQAGFSLVTQSTDPLPNVDLSERTLTGIADLGRARDGDYRYQSSYRNIFEYGRARAPEPKLKNIERPATIQRAPTFTASGIISSSDSPVVILTNRNGIKYFAMINDTIESFVVESINIDSISVRSLDSTQFWLGIE